MMTTELVDGDLSFTQLANEWDALAQHSVTDTPFQTLAYQKAWWTHLHPEDAQLFSAIVRDDSDRLQAIGCFYNIDGTLYFNGCVEETDYLDLISPPDVIRIAWESVMECLVNTDMIRWHAFDLCNVPAKSPTRTILPDLATRYGFTFQEELHEVCPVVDLPGDFNDYLESLEAKQRREISRKLRRAQAAGMTTRFVNSDDDLDFAIDEFLELLQKSTFEKREWLNEGRRAVFREVAHAALESGTLQLLFIELEGKKAAALFNFDYKDRIWVYNSGLDPSLFSQLSPGVVLTAAAIEHAIQLGRSEFDFLRGNEDYKYRFGAVDTQVFRLHLSRRGGR